MFFPFFVTDIDFLDLYTIFAETLNLTPMKLHTELTDEQVAGAVAKAFEQLDQYKQHKISVMEQKLKRDIESLNADVEKRKNKVVDLVKKYATITVPDLFKEDDKPKPKAKRVPFDDEQVRSLVLAGKSVPEISKILDKSYGAVVQKLTKMGLKARNTRVTVKLREILPPFEYFTTHFINLLDIFNHTVNIILVVQ